VLQEAGTVGEIGGLGRNGGFEQKEISSMF